MITMIAAIDANRAIGFEGDLVFHSTKDMQFFKRQTEGRICVMGRKTADSLPSPLKNRQNVVLSRQLYKRKGFMTVSELDTILKLAKWQEVVVIGGQQLYEQFLPHCQKIYLTHFEDTAPQADTFFPDLTPHPFLATLRLTHEGTKEDPRSFTIKTYKRIGRPE